MLAGDLAAAAFVAARVESQPVATSLLQGLAEVSGDAHALLADYAASMETAHAALLTQVGEARGAQVEDAVRRGAHDAAARFAALQAGRRLPGASLAEMAEGQLVQPAGAEDPEVVDSRRFPDICGWRAGGQTFARSFLGRDGGGAGRPASGC